jgi:hypothetical protein
MSILHVARMGRYSSDHAVCEYAERIWKVAPLAIEPDESGAAFDPSRPNPNTSVPAIEIPAEGGHCA